MWRENITTGVLSFALLGYLSAWKTSLSRLSLKWIIILVELDLCKLFLNPWLYWKSNKLVFNLFSTGCTAVAGSRKVLPLAPVGAGAGGELGGTACAQFCRLLVLGGEQCLCCARICFACSVPPDSLQRGDGVEGDGFGYWDYCCGGVLSCVGNIIFINRDLLCEGMRLFGLFMWDMLCMIVNPGTVNMTVCVLLETLEWTFVHRKQYLLPKISISISLFFYLLLFMQQIEMCQCIQKEIHSKFKFKKLFIYPIYLGFCLQKSSKQKFVFPYWTSMHIR